MDFAASATASILGHRSHSVRLLRVVGAGRGLDPNLQPLDRLRLALLEVQLVALRLRIIEKPVDLLLAVVYIRVVSST